ncbi:MAG TPA: zinc ribbon domain-containing protein [Actinomycetota bacterium]
MPLYEYECPACGERFDARRGLDAPDPGCPACGADPVRRVFSLFAAPGGAAATASTAAAGCACGGACACGR